MRTNEYTANVALAATKVNPAAARLAAERSKQREVQAQRSRRNAKIIHSIIKFASVAIIAMIVYGQVS
jgi:hypothetical protein